MPVYPDSTTRQLNEKLGESPSVKDFGAIGDGAANDTDAFFKAVDSIAGIGGGAVFVPRGTYAIHDQLELKENVWFYGEGAASVILRAATIDDGKALIHVIGDNAGIADLKIDGAVTTPTILKYSVFSTNPMHADLLRNTSVYVRSGFSNFKMQGVIVTHTGGYAVILDADTADISRVEISDCIFEQNRPHIFETEDDVYTFGSWTGGIFYRGDCRSSEAKLFAVRGLIISRNQFRRNTGNQVWGHSWGFDVQHTGIITEGNTFEDIGRDGVLYGNVQGGSCKGNTFRRIGYLTSTDSDTPVQNAGGDTAVAIDTSGFCAGVDYSNNSVSESSGAEAFDLDGFRDGAIANNQVDGCLIGLNAGDTQNNGAGKRIAITGNVLTGCEYASMRLNDCEDCTVTGNTIEQPATATESPIQLNAVTAAGCKNNLITDNRIHWDKNDWCVKEAVAGAGTFTSAVANRVYGQHISGTNKGEFAKHDDSESSTAYILSTSDNTATTPSEEIIERLGFGVGAALRFATRIAGTRVEMAQLQDANRLYNVGLAAGKGAVTTGDRTALLWGNDCDAIATGKFYGDGFFALAGKGITEPGYSSTFLDADANLITTDQVGLIRYNAVSKVFEQSIAVLAGARVWSALGGGAVTGTANQITVTGSVISLPTNGVRIQAGVGITDAVLRLRGELAQTVPLQEWRKNDETVLAAIDAYGTLYTPAVAMRADNWSPGSSSIEGTYTAREIRFRQNASSEHANSGLISFRFFDFDSLTLIGAGASVGVRLVRLRDLVRVSGVALGPALIAESGYIDSAEGFYTGATTTNAIQAPTGGVTARFIIGTRSFSMTADTAANAGATTAGNGRIYFDSTANKFKVSESGAAYVDLLGGTLSGLTSGRIPYTAGANSLADSANLAWNNAGQVLTITGNLLAEPGLNVLTGYIDSAGGFVTTATATNAIQAPTGGVTARYLVGTRSFSMTGDSEANAGLSTSGNGRFFFDSTLNRFRVSQHGNAYTDLIGGLSGSLTAGRIPYATGASALGDSGNLTWDNAAQVMVITGNVITDPALNILVGYLDSAGGFNTSNTTTNAIQAAVGGVTARYLIGTRSLSLIGDTAANAGLSTSGNGRFYYDSSTNKFRVSENGAAYIDLLSGAGLTGSLTSGRVPYSTGASSLADSANLAWDNAGQVLNITGNLISEPGLNVLVGYIDAAGGFRTSSTLTNAIQAPSGGVTVRYLVGTTSVSLIADSLANAGSSTLGNGRIYFDSTSNKFRVSEHGNVYVDLIGSSVTGAFVTGRIPFTTGSASLSDTANMVWNNTTRTLGISAQTSATPGIDVIQGYISAAGGFTTTAGNFNSIQSAGGVRTVGKIYIGFSASFNDGVGVFGRSLGGGVVGTHTQTQSLQAACILDTYDDGFSPGAVPALVGRRARGTMASPAQVQADDTLLIFGGRGWQSGASDFPTSLCAAITFQSAGAATTSSTPSKIIFATTPDGSLTRLTRLTIHKNGLVEIGGIASSSALNLNAGYISSAEGFFCAGAADSALNLPSGGAWCNKLITKTACYMITVGTGAGPASPGGGYGGFAHRSGSTYWYWNGGTWASADLAAISGGGGGVTSLTGTGLEVEVSAPTGAVTVGLPSSVLIANQLQVNGFSGAAIYCPSAYIQGRGIISSGLGAWNAIQVTDGGIAASSSYGFSLIDASAGFTQDLAIDHSGGGARFVGTGGVNCSSTGGISGAGFNPNVGGSVFTGYSSDASGSGFGDVLQFSSLVSGVPKTIQLRFTRGACTFYASF